MRIKAWKNSSVTLKESLKIIERKTNNSNKMLPLLNAKKAWQTIPAGSLKKWEPSRKHTKNKLKLVTEAD